MINVYVIAVPTKYESAVRNTFNSKFQNKCNVVVCKDNSGISEAEKKADTVVVAYDATEGITTSFSEVAQTLKKDGVKPFLLVINGDKFEKQRTCNPLAESWTNCDPNFPTKSAYFITMFLDAEKGMIGVQPRVEKDDSQFFLHLMTRQKQLKSEDDRTMEL